MQNTTTQPGCGVTEQDIITACNKPYKVTLMSWSKWYAIPRKLRIERGATRCVMEHTQHGIELHCIHITG